MVDKVETIAASYFWHFGKDLRGDDMQIHYHGRHALSTYLLTLQPVTDSSVYVSGFPWNEGYTRRNCQECPKKFMRSFQTLETIRFFFLEFQYLPDIQNFGN